jgi:outer membrane lipase/esterase
MGNTHQMALQNHLVTARVRTAMLAFVTALAAAISPATAQFTGITDFGDSYADTGSAPGGAFRFMGWTGCPVGPSPLYPTCRFTGGTNFVDSLQSIYGLPTATNFAIGGARTDQSNTMPAPLNQNGYGFQNELNTFAASGMRFSKSDLVVLSIGGNDTSLVNSLDAIPQVNASAMASAARAIAGVRQLVAAGAHNLVWYSAGNGIYFPSPPPGSNNLPLSGEQRTAWAHTYYQQIQQSLAPIAHSGVRIFLFDYEILQARIAANPGRYGFGSGGGCQIALGVNGCAGLTPAEQNSYFYWNAVHPTSAGMALVARYMANQMDAPLTVVPQGGVSASIAANFATSLFGRIDAYRTFQAYGVGSGMAMSMKDAGAAAPEKRWSMYADVNYGRSSLEGRFLSADYDAQSASGAAGIEYRVDPRLRLGGEFSYSAPDVSFGVQNAHDHIDAYQLAGYGSVTDSNWFADALVAYGRNDFTLDRQGIIDVIHGSTGANAFTAASKAGYLLNVGPIRAGPIAGFNYMHGFIQGYTETGDQLITMMVDGQSLDALTGDAGLQARFPFLAGGGLYSPYVNITAEHDFLGASRTVTTTQATAPLLPVITPVPYTGGLYGKIAAGVAVTIAGNLSASLNGATTFAHRGGDDVVISIGIKNTF